MYEGHRATVVEIIPADDGKRLADFVKLPASAAWNNQPVGETLMPVLASGNKHVHIVMPFTTKAGKRVMPDPDNPSGPPAYMAAGMWFEDCGDGGCYVLGAGDNVLLFYVDGTGDMIYGRWMCTRVQWAALWATFLLGEPVDRAAQLKIAAHCPP